MQRLKGSSSVFFALTLLLISSLLFTLLEGARIDGLKSCASLNGELVNESLLAEYVRPLWERYHLFLTDGSDRAGNFKVSELENNACSLSAENLKKDTSSGRDYRMYFLEIQSVKMQQYALVTDNKGKDFYHLAVDYMKENFALEAAEILYSSLQEAEQITKDTGDVEQKVAVAKSGIEEARLEAEEAEKKEAQETKKQSVKEENSVSEVQMPENPLGLLDDWRRSGVLTLLGVDTEKLSKKSADKGNSLEKRQKNKGTAGVKKKSGWYETVLFQEYLMKYFSSYRKAAKIEGGHALDYELEYMIAGKASDKENLTAVCTKLLAVREAANFVYLQTDSAKCEQAYSLATLLAGFSGNPLLVEGVKQAILVVWAFAESVSDVKGLLAGQKIPLIKTANDWTMGLDGLTDKQEFTKSNSCEKGLSYEEYLRVLLFLTKDEKVCFRAMDVIEWNVHGEKGYENLRMDCLIHSFSMSYVYQAKQLFLSFVTVGKQRDKNYKWTFDRKASYFAEWN